MSNVRTDAIRASGDSNAKPPTIVRAHALPFDTSADAHAVQRDIYRRLGARGRLAIMFRLNDTARRVAMSGIRARHPAYTDDQVLHAYARLVLGDAAVRAAWPDRTPVEP